MHVTLADAPVPGSTARTFRMSSGEYVIVVQRATTEIHRLHNVFHETAHLLLGTLHSTEHHPDARFMPADRPDPRAAPAQTEVEHAPRSERDAEVIARTLTAHGLALSHIRFTSDIDSAAAGIDAIWTTDTWTL